MRRKVGKMKVVSTISELDIVEDNYQSHSNWINGNMELIILYEVSNMTPIIELS